MQSSPASSAPPIANATSSISPQPAETVSRRNHDRLLGRCRKAEEVAQKVRQGLHQIGIALEEVLNEGEGELQTRAYGKIVAISDMVDSLKKA